MSETTQRGRGGMITGVFLIGLGIIFALGQIFQINFWQFTWPFFIIVPGLMFFVAMVMAGKPGGPLAIPGSIVTTVGVIFLFQSLTNMYYTWAYVWALIPASVGLGMMIGGRWSGSEAMAINGRRIMIGFFLVFLFFAVLMELVFNIHGNPFAPYVWPGLMILVGIWLLLRRSGGTQLSDGNGRVQERRTPPVPPTPPMPPARPIAAAPVTQFEPIDKTRGKRKPAPKKESTGEPEV